MLPHATKQWSLYSGKLWLQNVFLKLWAKLCSDDLIAGQSQEAYLLLVCINPWTLSSVVGAYKTHVSEV